MNKIKIILIFLICTLFINHSAISQIKTFIKAFKEAHTQQFFDMTKTFDNGSVFVGQQEVHGAPPTDGCDVLLMKVDSCGELLFYKSIGLSHKHSDGGRSVKEISNNNLLVAGFYMFGKETGSVTVFNSNGDYIWSKMYDGVRFFTDAIETSSGDIVASGYSNDNKAVIFKFNNLGTLVWKKEINNIGMNSRGYSVSEFSNGNYCFVWHSLFPVSDINVSSIDINGNMVWSKSIGQGANMPIYREWEANSIIDPNDNNVLITTSTTKLGNGSETDPDILLFKIDEQGNIIWAYTYGNTGDDDQPKKMSFDSVKNEILLSGKTNHVLPGISIVEPMIGDNALILRLNNNGDLISANVYGGSGVDKMQKVVAYNNYYMSAMDCLNSLGSNEFDPFILKLDSNLQTGCQNKQFSMSYQLVSPNINNLNFGTSDYFCTDRIQAPNVGTMSTHFETICQSCDPYFEILGDNIICPKDSIVLVKKDGCLSFFTINGSTYNEDTIIFTYPEGGHYQIVVNHECIEQPFIYNVFVSDPQASFMWEDKCLYDSIRFYDQSISNYSPISKWYWDFNDNSNDSTQNSEHIFSNDGNYEVSLIVTTDHGCKDTVTNSVKVYPIPVPIILAKNECLYDSVYFRDSTLINAPSNISHYTINYGDGTLPDTNINSKHKYSQPGIYNVTYETVSNRGCVNDTNISIEIYTLPIANFTNTTVCENQPPTEFTDLSQISNGSIIEYQWNFGTDDNNITFSYPNPVHSYVSSGDYSTRLIIKSDKGCYDTTEKTITILPKPTGFFISNITGDCSPLCVDFYDHTVSNSNNSLLLWNWNFSNGETSNEQNPSKCFYNTSNVSDSSISVELITLNELGCYDTLYAENYLHIYHNPISIFNVSSNIVNMYETEIYFDNSSVGANYYSWNFGDDKYSMSYSPSHIYEDTGTYTIQLIVETENACFDTSYRNVRVNPVPSLYMPNTFSPNGDGVNDFFFFKNYAFVEEGLEFRIFDKWGELIYSTNKFKPWDGTYKGHIAKQDTYIWKLRCFDFFGNEYNYKGHVNLIK